MSVILVHLAEPAPPSESVKGLSAETSLRGAVLAVTLNPGAAGDTTTIHDTLFETILNLSQLEESSEVGTRELVADKGYHSNETITALEDVGMRSYIVEPDRGRRRWKGKEDAQRAVYANRRRIKGARGKTHHRKRCELVERTFAHCLETGGMRRVHLRGRENIEKRYLVHVAAFNLGVLMRTVIGFGTPRGLQRGVALAAEAYRALWWVTRLLLRFWPIRIEALEIRTPGTCVA